MRPETITKGGRLVYYGLRMGIRLFPPFSVTPGWHKSIPGGPKALSSMFCVYRMQPAD